MDCNLEHSGNITKVLKLLTLSMTSEKNGRVWTQSIAVLAEYNQLQYRTQSRSS